MVGSLKSWRRANFGMWDVPVSDDCLVGQVPSRMSAALHESAGDASKSDAAVALVGVDACSVALVGSVGHLGSMVLLD